MRTLNYSSNSVIGIDVSKETLDICVLLGERSISFKTKNTPDGFERLNSWLQQQGCNDPLPTCLEATGAYSLGIAIYLHQHGHPVWMVNPMQINGFFKARLVRSKTDATDARLIADFARSTGSDLPLWQPRPEAYQALVELVHHYHYLVDLRASSKNRLQRGDYNISSSRNVIEGSEKRIIGHLDKEIERIKRDILQLIAKESELSERFERLKTIPGVGEGMAMTFMAEVPAIQRFRKPKQLAAYAGLTPRIRHSGKRTPESQPISKMGNANLRQALYRSALAARIHNPGLNPLTLRLQAKGKKPKVVITAVMRKLLHQMHAVDSHKTNFDRNYQKLQPQQGLI